jgi:hypothetical protein
MVIGAEARRAARSVLLGNRFGDDSGAALDLLAIADMAWHDAYGDLSVPDDVLDDVIVLCRGDIGALVQSVSLALQDWRDLRMNADAARARSDA